VWSATGNHKMIPAQWQSIFNNSILYPFHAEGSFLMNCDDAKRFELVK